MTAKWKTAALGLISAVVIVCLGQWTILQHASSQVVHRDAAPEPAPLPADLHDSGPPAVSSGGLTGGGERR